MQASVASMVHDSMISMSHKTISQITQLGVMTLPHTHAHNTNDKRKSAHESYPCSCHRMPFLWTLRDGSFSSQARLLQSSAPDVLASALTLQQTIQKKTAEDEQAKKAAEEEVPQEPQTSAVEADEQDDDDYDDFLYAQAIAERGETMEDEEDESMPFGGSTSHGGNRPPKALNAKAKTAPAAPTPSQTQPEEIEVAPMDLDAMGGFPVRPGVVIPSKCVTVASLRLTSESCELFAVPKNLPAAGAAKWPVEVAKLRVGLGHLEAMLGGTAGAKVKDQVVKSTLTALKRLGTAANDKKLKCTVDTGLFSVKCAAVREALEKCKDMRAQCMDIWLH